MVTTVSYSKKKVVFTEGDECKGLYIVKHGRIKLVRSSSGGREQIIKILTPETSSGWRYFTTARTMKITPWQWKKLSSVSYPRMIF